MRYANQKNHAKLTIGTHIKGIKMKQPSPDLIEDAVETNEIFLDAIYHCFEQEIHPSVLYTQALNTVLIAMFECATDKKIAVEAAQRCITSAMMMTEDQETIQ